MRLRMGCYQFDPTAIKPDPFTPKAAQAVKAETFGSMAGDSMDFLRLTPPPVPSRPGMAFPPHPPRLTVLDQVWLIVDTVNVVTPYLE